MNDPRQALAGPGSRPDRAAELIHRYLSDAVDEADCAELQALLAEPEHRQAFLAAAMLEGRLRHGGAALAELTCSAAERTTAPHRRTAAVVALAAAVLLLAALEFTAAGAPDSTAPAPTGKAERTVRLQIDGPSLPGWAVAASGARSEAGVALVRRSDARQDLAAAFMTLHGRPRP